MMSKSNEVNVTRRLITVASGALPLAFASFNHLDLARRKALGMALNELECTVTLTSHDRSLQRALCDEFWPVPRSGIEPFDRDLDNY
jgi:hypothetical protein